MFRGRGRNFYYSKKNRGGHSSIASKAKYVPCPTKASNQFNQYYMDRFYKKYKESNAKGNQNVAQNYKRIWTALSKYPMPIIDIKQAQMLEGIGETTSKIFHSFIEERNREFESNQDKIEGNEEGKYLNLNEKIIAEDHIIQAKDKNKKPIFRKRKFAEIENDENSVNIDDSFFDKPKRRKKMEGFLDVGSTTWSIILACYFISRHKGDDPEEVLFDQASIKNMLIIMHRQSNGNIPVEKKFDLDEFQRLIKGELIEEKESGFYAITEKGIKKIDKLRKEVGIIVEHDRIPGQHNKEKLNSVTVSLFDKNLAPAIEEFTRAEPVKKEKLIPEEEDRLFGNYNIKLEALIDGHKRLAEKREFDFENEGFLSRWLIDSEEDQTFDEAHPTFNIKQKPSEEIIEEDEDEDDQDDDALINNLIVENKAIQSKNSDQLVPKVKTEMRQFKFVMYIDNREIRTQQDRKYLYNKLTDAGIYCEQK